MRKATIVVAAACAVVAGPGGGAVRAADEPPVLRVLGEFDTALGAGNAEIVDADAATGLAFLTCGDDRSVRVIDFTDPAAPRAVRRDALEAGEPTSVALHPTGGWYAVGVRGALASGNDAVILRSAADGTVLRTFDLGFGRGPDCVAASPDGRWIAVCLEAEDPWIPGAVAFLRCGDDRSARAVQGPLEVALDGLVPSVGAFSHRWVDRAYNGPFPGGASASTAAGAVTVRDGDHCASDPSGDLQNGTEVTFRRADSVAKGTFLWKGAVSDGEDGNVFLFPLDGSANALEPEFAAFSPDSALCAVTLQENNAILVIDVSGDAPRVRAKNGVLGLGAVDHAADLTRKDPEKDSPAKFTERLKAEREPDGIALAVLGGRLCAVTADEGDTYASGPAGRHRVRGGRTVSVVALDDGTVLGDTGNALDAACDAAGRWGAFVEAKRAETGGSEPENLALFTRGDRTLCAVGLERANAVALVDVTDPGAPRVPGLEGMGGLSGKGVRKAPEGVRAVRRGDRTLLLVAFEASGTMGVFEVR